MKKARNRRGFSLLELIIAVSISSIVLIGIFSIAASMVQFEVESARKGSISAWTMASITSMNRDIAGASVLQWPNGNGASADTLLVCTNWSRLIAPTPDGGRLSFIGPAPTITSYCWDGGTHLLRRSALAGNCPNMPTVPPACGAGNYPDVVATSVYKDVGNPDIFTAEVHGTGVDGYAVRLRYVVGNPNQGTVDLPGGPGTIFVNPQSLSFDTKILLEN